MEPRISLGLLVSHGLLVVLIVLGGCKGTSVTPGALASIYPTYTRYPTYTPLATYTPRSQVSGISEPLGTQGISWQDASAHIGQHAVISGKVVATHNSGRAVFLNFSSDYQHTFTGVVFPEDWGKFAEPPEHMYHGKQVRITGTIVEYRGAPEIIIREPAQVEIVAAATTCPPCPTCATASPRPITPEPISRPTTAAQTVVPSSTVETIPVPVVTIPYDQAGYHVGEEVTVTGRVVDTYRSANVVRLNFHENWRQHFNVAIFPEAWSLFPAPPEQLFRDQQVRVKGVVEEYQGAPEIIVRSLEQIVIVEGE
jgi:DNA/RNA endonuclease YhcR with UshA esterase domain